MKRFSIYISITILLLFAKTSIAQNSCNCYTVQLDPVSDCCAELVIAFNPNCDLSAFFINQITINTNVFPPYIGEISSINLYNSNVSYSLNGSNDFATITHSSNFLTAANSNGGQEVLGEVCFNNAQAGLITSELIIYDGLVECPSYSEMPINCIPPAPWTKIYGDEDENKPNKVKAFGDGVFVLGQTIINGEEFPTISKFNLTTGGLIWERQLDFSSRLTDLEYDDVNSEIIAVGYTLPDVINGDGYIY